MDKIQHSYDNKKTCAMILLHAINEIIKLNDHELINKLTDIYYPYVKDEKNELKKFNEFIFLSWLLCDEKIFHEKIIVEIYFKEKNLDEMLWKLKCIEILLKSLGDELRFFNDELLRNNLKIIFYEIEKLLMKALIDKKQLEAEFNKFIELSKSSLSISIISLQKEKEILCKEIFQLKEQQRQDFEKISSSIHNAMKKYPNTPEIKLLKDEIKYCLKQHEDGHFSANKLFKKNMENMGKIKELSLKENNGNKVSFMQSLQARSNSDLDCSLYKCYEERENNINVKERKASNIEKHKKQVIEILEKLNNDPLSFLSLHKNDLKFLEEITQNSKIANINEEKNELNNSNVKNF